MKTVTFANDGLLDLDVIRLLGVSVKESDGPIGYFGTGLKYALAVLLRNDHEVILRVGGEEYEFTARERNVRGVAQEVVFMNEEMLGFTTQLGRNWEIWQAYRELHSNHLDEPRRKTISDSPVSGYDTQIEVTGDAFWYEYQNRDLIFVSGEPMAANESIQVYNRPSRHVYYRGVRAGTLPEEGPFTYNILVPMRLTEDRTFLSDFDVEFKLETLLPTLNHRGLFARIAESDSKSREGSLDFSYCGNPSDEFLDACDRTGNDLNAQPSMRQRAEDRRQQKGQFDTVELSGSRLREFTEAFEPLARLECDLRPEEVMVATHLGSGVYGMYHSATGQIYVSEIAIDMGSKFLTATLYEEWLHRSRGLHDNTRSMQDHLLQKLVSLVTD